MNKFILCLPIVLLVGVGGCQQSQDDRQGTPIQSTKAPVLMPGPGEMKVDVLVSGRVSTLKHIDIVNVGKNIPYTYSEGKVNNTPGFDWWLSRHFALKTDYPEERARLFLELLEMSYPHYVEAYGGIEPPNIENQRIAVVYGSSWEKTMFAFYDDGFRRGIYAGGETMYYNRVGYNFPSHRWHHRRYIVIHETAHAFQMAQRGYSGGALNWLVEGLADTLAHHVYDPQKHQLQLMNFDRPPMNFVERGLEEYKRYERPSIRKILVEKREMRGIWLLFTHYMLNDPGRSHRYKRYQSEFIKLAEQSLSRAEIETITQEIFDQLFPDWNGFEKGFADWLATIENTYHVVKDPWEQDGNALWVRMDPPPDYRYGRKPKRNRPDGMARIDINLMPGERPSFSPYRVDYPQVEPSHLLGEISRGVAEPSIGMQIDYVKEHLHRGLVGLALGVKVTQDNLNALAIKDEDKRLEAHKPDADIMYQVIVKNGNTLVINGSAYAAQRLSYALPENLLAELASQAEPKLGLTIKIAEKELQVILRSGDRAEVQYKQAVPLSQEVRQQLLERPMALLGYDANHRMTPYLDDGRSLNPHPVDLNKPAAANFWRNPGDKHAERLYGVIWRLGEEQTPASVKSLYAEMVAAAAQSPQAQGAALERFRRQRKQMVDDIAATDFKNARQAIIELSGANLRLEWGAESADGHRMISAVLRNPSESILSGRLSLMFKAADGQAKPIAAQTIHVNPGDNARIMYQVAKPVWGVDNKIEADAQVQWEGQAFGLFASTRDRPYEGVELEVVKQAQIEGDEITLEVILLGPFGGKNIGEIAFEVLPGNIVEQARVVEKIDMDIYEVATFKQRFKLKSGADVSRFAVDVQADFVADGEELRLKARSVYE